MIAIILCLAAIVAIVGFYLALASDFFAGDVPGYADELHQYSGSEGDLQHLNDQALDEEFWRDIA